MKNPNLPEEILIEIFSRLPVKSVGICRCLSRSWRALLSNVEFLSLHFTQKPHQENLILIENSAGDKEDEEDEENEENFNLVENPDESIPTGHPIHIITFPISEEVVSKKLDLPNTWVRVLGSSNGLLLMLDDEDEMFLVNPVLKEQVEIPNSPFEPWNDYTYMKGFRNRILSRKYEEIYGFGYESSTDDYKILKLSTFGRHYPRHPGTAVDICSVKTGIWERSEFDIYVPSRGSGAFVNGALHWVGFDNDPPTEGPVFLDEPSNQPPVIFAFELASGELNEIPAPSPTHVEEFFKYGNTFVLRDCLCIVELKIMMTLVIDAWMMKEYGTQESWTKFRLCVESFPTNLKPLCYAGEDEDQLAYVNPSATSLNVCNLKDQTKKKMLVNGDALSIRDACVFVESLVSPSSLPFSAEQ